MYKNLMTIYIFLILITNFFDFIDCESWLESQVILVAKTSIATPM